MSDAPAENRLESPSHAQVVRWIWYGVGSGLVGLLFLGFICGPAAIYFGVRASKAAAARGERWPKVAAAFVIAFGVFDILFFIILAVGTIRVIGTRGY